MFIFIRTVKKATEIDWFFYHTHIDWFKLKYNYLILKEYRKLILSDKWYLFLGVGSQFLFLATGIMLMALLGMFNVHRHGSINASAVVLYALTSCKCFCRSTLVIEKNLFYIACPDKFLASGCNTFCTPNSSKPLGLKIMWIKTKCPLFLKPCI